MKVKYLGHSGFLLENTNTNYIFDYYEGNLPEMDINKPTVVFASHFHQDHYNAKIFDLLKEKGVKNIKAILSFDISKKKYPAGIEVLTADKNKAYGLENGDTLTTYFSTDSGVAFLLETEGKAIYHAGDLNDWRWDGESKKNNLDMKNAYQNEINKLKNKNIDIAFVVLDPRQEIYKFDGMKYFLENVNVKTVYPMHYWGEKDIIKEFLQEYPQYSGKIEFTER